MFSRSTYFLLAAVVMLIVTTSLFFNRWRQYNDANNWLTHTYEVIIDIDDLSSALIEGKATEREFLLTKEESSRQAHEKSEQIARDTVLQLGVLTQDNQRQQERIHLLSEQITARFLYSKTTIALVHEGHTEQAIARIHYPEEEMIVTLLRALREEEANLLTVRGQKAALEEREVLLVLVIGNFLVVIVSMIALAKTRQEMQTRVQAQRELAETRAYIGEQIKMFRGT